MKIPIMGRNRGLHDLQLLFDADTGATSGATGGSTTTEAPTAPDPIEPAPAAEGATEGQSQVLEDLAAQLGLKPEDLKAALSALKLPAKAPAAKAPAVQAEDPDDPEAPEKPEAPDDPEVPEDPEAPEAPAEPELSPADRELRSLKVLEAAREEAEALGLSFHKGALKTLSKAGAFGDVAFDAQNEPTNVRAVVEAIARDNPWAVQKGKAVPTGGRDNGRSTDIISDDDLKAAASKYGISRYR